MEWEIEWILNHPERYENEMHQKTVIFHITQRYHLAKIKKVMNRIEAERKEDPIKFEKYQIYPELKDTIVNIPDLKDAILNHPEQYENEMHQKTVIFHITQLYHLAEIKEVMNRIEAERKEYPIKYEKYQIHSDLKDAILNQGE